MITIKSKQEIELMQISADIASGAMRLIGEAIKVGVTTKELNHIAEEHIKSHDAHPSFLGYSGFPASICASVNEEVVHGIPSKRKLKDGDIVGIDLGAYKKWLS